MINIHSIQEIKPMARSYPKAGYDRIKHDTTEQLRREVNDIYARQHKQESNGVRLRGNGESVRPRAPITTHRNNDAIPLTQDRSGAIFSGSWREGFELALIIGFELALIIGFVMMAVLGAYQVMS